jgi:RNA polymerase-binding transcription factor DksA
MNESDRIKSILEKDLLLVTKELETIANHDAIGDDWEAVPSESAYEGADENIEADQVEEWNERRALVSQLETHYRNIKRALEKIEAGTYGICEISGEPIEADRLEANPTARTNKKNMDRERELSL